MINQICAGLFVFITLLLVTGCENPLDTDAFLDKENPNIIAVLHHYSNTTHLDINNVRQDSYMAAYFTNGSNFVSPMAVILDSNYLPLMVESGGQYGDIVDIWNLESGTINWKIIGYLGANLDFNQKFATPMDYVNFKWGDTISKSKGLTISYKGFQNSGDLSFSIQNAPYTNEFYLNDTTDYQINDIFRSVPDNGKISILPIDLTNLKSNRYYSFTIDHEVSEVENFNGKSILKRSINYLTLDFYLSD